MWKHLKARKLGGRRFTKQHSIRHYIVDFYCSEEKMIVELDGEVHNNPVAEEYDEQRDLYLKNLGYQVLRFENKLVFDDLDLVLTEIKDRFKSE